MKKKLTLLYSWFIRTSMYFLPDIPVIMRFRGFLYSILMKKRGKNLQVASSSTLKGLQNISVGNNCFFALNTIVDASTFITFEDDVMIGYSSIIVAGNHTKINNSYRYGKPDRTPILIQHGSWVGANCVILAGSIIPPASCIAAGTVITKKLEKTGVYYRHSQIKCK